MSSFLGIPLPGSGFGEAARDLQNNSLSDMRSQIGQLLNQQSNPLAIAARARDEALLPGLAAADQYSNAHSNTVGVRDIMRARSFAAGSSAYTQAYQQALAQNIQTRMGAIQSYGNMANLYGNQAAGYEAQSAAAGGALGQLLGFGLSYLKGGK